MLRYACIMLWLLAVLACPTGPDWLPTTARPVAGTGLALAAPPGPGDLARFIETAKRSIAEHEKTIQAYNAEMRTTVANDPPAARRREEIRILKQYYVREIEAHRAKIIEDSKKIQEFPASGAQ